MTIFESYQHFIRLTMLLSYLWSRRLNYRWYNYITVYNISMRPDEFWNTDYFRKYLQHPFAASSLRMFYLLWFWMIINKNLWIVKNYCAVGTHMIRVILWNIEMFCRKIKLPIWWSIKIWVHRHSQTFNLPYYKFNVNMF